jgi:hypothetical protein
MDVRAAASRLAQTDFWVYPRSTRDRSLHFRQLDDADSPRLTFDRVLPISSIDHKATVWF